MPVSVSIDPFCPTIDMYDSPDTSSAYSLSGHIVISLTPSSSLLGLSRSAPQNLLLTDLELTFEGQSELVLNDIGYAPLRLISVTKQLVDPSAPVSIFADENDRAEWRVVFDLAVPGWLPATAVFGDDEQRSAGVSYALFARARFLSADLDDAPAPATASSSLWTNLCAAVRLAPNRPRSVHAQPLPITLTRHVSPPLEDAEFPRVAYAIQVADAGASTNIPTDILSTLQVHVLVPSRTSMNEDTVSIVLRMRAVGGDTHLRVLGFEADVMQLESFQTTPSPSYRARFPLPPPAQQPPAVPLKAPHPVGALFELGLVGAPSPNARASREKSLVPSGERKLFRVRGADTQAHAQGVELEDAWLRMEASVPVSPQEFRATEDGPLCTVRHELRIRLSVGHDNPSDRATSDELVFSVPLEFVRRAPERASSSTFFYATAGLSTASLPLLPHPGMSARAPSPTRSVGAAGSASRASTPAPPALLPAYSQLFHENGDRKEEAGALPLYREKEEEEGETSSSSSEDMPLTPVSPLTPLTPDEPRTPPGLVTPKDRPRKFGESFLPFDDDEEEEDYATEEGNVQYGIAF